VGRDEELKAREAADAAEAEAEAAVRRRLSNEQEAAYQRWRAAAAADAARVRSPAEEPAR